MRLLALTAAVLLARAPAPEVCGALNVTVSPGPVVDYLEGENATLLCHVSQKRRKDSLLAVRWFFARPDAQEALMVKMTKLRMVQYYGNFSRSAYRQRLRLLEQRRGTLYTLSVLTLQPADQGHYVCKVQEISKHRNKWTAWSNGSSGTEVRGFLSHPQARGTSPGLLSALPHPLPLTMDCWTTVFSFLLCS
uniref:V-set and transmembrane domain-containing protein 4 n=1 Tax=Catagonus wagneri TaxID=51154 RepID=A0A8C3YVZ9_9CETA